MKPEPIPTDAEISTLADGVLRRLEKPTRGNPELAIAAMAVAMCALARMEKIDLSDLRECLDIAHAQINPKLDS